jgi:hypothetical protein
LLTAAVKGGVFAAHMHLDPVHTRLDCTYTDGKPVNETTWSLEFSFAPYPPVNPSVAAAKHAWDVSYQAVRGRKPAPTRLRNFGADDAWATETENTTAVQGPLMSSEVEWRKGSYLGEIMFTAPLSSHLGDIEDAELLLRDLMKGFPR